MTLVSLSIGSLRLLRLLVVLELLSWLFVILVPNTSTLNYLLVQRYFLILRIARILFLPSLLIIVFLLKLGIPPFHIWFIKIARVLNKNRFSFIITLHKLIPILFLSKVIFRIISFIIIWLRLIVVGLALISRRTLFFTLIYSSIVHSIWIILSMILSKGFVLFYWVIYRSLLVILVSLINFIKIENSYLTQRVFLSKCWLLMSGIPPFLLFWFKVYLLVWIIYLFGLFIRVVVITVRVFALTSYYRTWHFGRLLDRRIINTQIISPFIIILVFWTSF